VLMRCIHTNAGVARFKNLSMIREWGRLVVKGFDSNATIQHDRQGSC
jgi:hypothetical protein